MCRNDELLPDDELKPTEILNMLKRLKAAEDQLYILTIEERWGDVASYIRLKTGVKEIIMKLDNMITDILEGI